jgi:hypothetical protein
MQGTSFSSHATVSYVSVGYDNDRKDYSMLCVDNSLNKFMYGSVKTVVVMFDFLRWKLFASSIVFQLRLDGLSGVTRNLMQGTSETKA